MRYFHRIALCLLCSLILFLPIRSFAAITPQSDAVRVSAKSAILIEQNTGTVLWEQNADEKMPPASITKIMTLLLTMEALDAKKIALTDSVTGSEHAASMGGSQIWLEVGEVFTVEELLKAAAIASANDASMALAEYIGGSEQNFVQLMNQKAKALGMQNTVFYNPTGLDADGHVSTARDIALMSKALLAYPDITNYTTVWMDSLRGGQMGLVNTNKLVRFYEGCTGLKTGTTDGAGSCLSASATRNGLSLIAVVMGCKTSKDRFADARALLDYGFANYEQYTPTLPEDIPDEIPVIGGMALSVSLQKPTPPAILLQKGDSASITVDVTYAKDAHAPVQKGDALGSICYKHKDEVLCELSLLAAEDIRALDFGNAFASLLKLLFA